MKREIKIESALEVSPHQIDTLIKIFNQIPADESKKNLKGEPKNGAD
jgi:hypothetical protein